MENCCPFCKAPLKEGPKLEFRAICGTCSRELHCCDACRFHAPGYPNECRKSDTEFVKDRDRANLCEEFLLKETVFKRDENALERAKRLLGEI